MRSAVVAKSLTDLTRRRARTAFAVASLSLAVASLGVFAVEPMMDDVMQEEVASTRLADLTVETRPPLDWPTWRASSAFRTSPWLSRAACLRRASTRASAARTRYWSGSTTTSVSR